jgi:DNA repair protein RecO (recombination protein O)
MKQLNTQAIVLSRTEFGEADRILTLLTPEYGKIRVMAKGVRRVKSKLAGGIELFSVSDVAFIKGRSDIGTLMSSRLRKYYGNIVKDIERTMLGYDLIKQLSQSTGDEPEPEFFALLEQAFEALDNFDINLGLIRVWFSAQLLRLNGHTPNLQTETSGEKLSSDGSYEFSVDDAALVRNVHGNLCADDIKFMRLLFGGNQPVVLANIVGIKTRVETAEPFVRLMQQHYIR